MKQEAAAAGTKECSHLWFELGYSKQNGRRYTRCEKCGLIREHNLPYIA